MRKVSVQRNGAMLAVRDIAKFQPFVVPRKKARRRKQIVRLLNKYKAPRRSSSSVCDFPIWENGGIRRCSFFTRNISAMLNHELRAHAKPDSEIPSHHGRETSEASTPPMNRNGATFDGAKDRVWEETCGAFPEKKADESTKGDAGSVEEAIAKENHSRGTRGSDNLERLHYMKK